jgi:hypothetical protein
MTARKIIPFVLFLSLVLSGCNLFANVPPGVVATVTSAAAPLASKTPLVLTATLPSETLTPTPALTSTETLPPTQTLTPTPALSMTPTITPTYAILRGTANVEKVSCRYGPGPDYLYMYPILQGSTQDVIGRTDTGKWVLTRSHGDNKSCWAKAEFLTLNGDVMSLEMVYPDKFTLLRSSQKYRFPYNVAAVRNGDKVTITWESDERRPGDQEDATSVLYMVEVWVCKDGQVTFTPIGTSIRQVSITDEAGCAEPSHGRIYFVEKHGYTGPSPIPWPQP